MKPVEIKKRAARRIRAGDRVFRRNAMGQRTTLDVLEELGAIGVGVRQLLKPPD